MATNLKQPTQTALAATALTPVYTCPPGYSIKVTVFICNRSSAAIQFRLSLAVGGAADHAKQYLYYDAELPGNDSLELVKLCLNQTDVLRAFASTGDATVQVLVDEVLSLI